MLALLLAPAQARAAESLCDPSFQNCRTPLINLIRAENIGIDVGFWFMEDLRYVSELIARHKAGVPVRLIVDPTANPTYPLNATALSTFQKAGVPMIKKRAGGIMHFKMMLFAGQDVVEFGSANYSPNAFVPVAPYTNYIAETVFFEDDPVIVNSFKRKFDDLWIDKANYASYANVSTRVRTYPQYAISPDMNFPPGQDYATRAVNLYNKETQRLDVMMYRVTDRRHSDAMIAAKRRGIAVRYLGETLEYRKESRLWVSWNMDRMYAAGIPMRVRSAAGENHAKVVLLHSQGITVFGSSNWTSPSANSQQEHNYFTKKDWIFDWFSAQFERKWNNMHGKETTPFVPLAPDKPANVSIANRATGVAKSGQKLTWHGGPWAHVYDIYFGTNPTPPLYAANRELGPSETSSENQSFTLPTLTAGTTYYWKIVSKTAANKTKTGETWSFTTAGSAPSASANEATPIAGATAAGRWALRDMDAGKATLDAALASPANYFAQPFTVLRSVAYHVWNALATTTR